MKFRYVLVFCLSVPLSAIAFDEFADFTPDLPVVVSASRLNQSVLTSPSSVTVIDSAMIEASGFIEIADIFRLVPGFQVAHANGNTYTVISHGEGWEYPNRMQLLIDGRSTYTSALSAIDWNTIGIHIEDIDRIEVVRGPAASAYGSNSYAGAINIITKAPELDDQIQIRYRMGNAGEKEALLRHSGQFENLSYRLTASTRQNDGFEEYTESRIGPASPQVQFFNDYRDDRDIDDLSFTGRVQLNSNNALWSHFSYTSGEAEMPNSFPELDKGLFERDRDINAWSANVRWDHRISDAKELKVNFFHNYLDENDMASSYPLSEILGITPALFSAVFGEPDQPIEYGERTYHTHRSDLEMQYSQINDNGLQFVVGAGVRYDTMRSEAFFPTEGTATNFGHRFFGNFQLPVASFLTANLGALYELNQTERPHFSPRGSLNFHLNSLQTVRLGYSRAYRIPSLLEENSQGGIFLDSGTEFLSLFRSADDLKAEQVTSVDISYLGRLSQAPINWEVRAYREEYDDTIVFYVDQGYPTGLDDFDLKILDNAAQSTMYGLEGELTFRPEQFSFVRLHFNYGHMTGSRIARINQSSPKPPTDVRSLEAHAPNKSYGILAAKQFGSWQVNLGFYHVGKMKWDGLGDEVDSYNRLDASVSKKFALSGKQQLVFKLAGQNITNNDYNEFAIDTDLKFDPRYYASISFVHF